MVPVLYSISVLDLKILTWEEKKKDEAGASPAVIPATQTAHGD
jgi:hypothetical protein